MFICLFSIFLDYPRAQRHYCIVGKNTPGYNYKIKAERVGTRTAFQLVLRHCECTMSVRNFF